eukprot:scaffold1823_cov38-Cyclotella_meneghiniana.AAC.6
MVIGIIRPPPEIRAVADKTALFVSKNGRAFEHKILNSAKGSTPKFAFLQPNSPFHAYYEDKISFYERGGDDNDDKEEEERKRQKEEEERRIRSEEIIKAKKLKENANKMKASAVDPVARILLKCRAQIEEARRVAGSNSSGAADNDNHRDSSMIKPPPALHHVSVTAPTNLSPLQIEIIKLTAQYVALSGKHTTETNNRQSFVNNLTLKEWTNSEFAFLQPRHGHYAYFTALVDGYRRFMPGGEDYESMKVRGKRDRLSSMMMNDDTTTTTTAATTSASNHKNHEQIIKQCLNAAAYRAEYERDATNRKREAIQNAAGGSAVLGGAGTIDWHDFVVVATIDFGKEEVVEATAPGVSLRLAALTANSNKVENGNEIKNTEENNKEEEDDGNMEESEEEGSDMDRDDDDDDDDEEKLKVVSNYQPRVVSTKEITGDSSKTHIIDPISGKSIAIADMPEHMRIQLLDPKWAEEKKRFAEKQRETNYVASGEDISANIQRLAAARGDLFGMSQAEMDSQKLDSERRLMEANEIIRNQMQGPALPGSVAPLATATGSVMPPPPPPPPQPMGLQNMDGLEPAAKKQKIEESQQANVMTMPAPPPPPVPLAGLGFAVPPPGMQPPFDPNAAAAGETLPLPPPSQEPTILSEQDFIATLDNPNELYFCVTIPHDPSNSSWNFNGQTIDITTLNAKSKIKQVKEVLKSQLGGMPMNKMQLKHPVSGFMNKDALSLAHFNVGPGMTIELVPKTRGGRK